MQTTYIPVRRDRLHEKGTWLVQTHPTRTPVREVSVNVIARDAARVLAHRVYIRQNGQVARLTKHSKLYGTFMSALTVQIRNRLKDVDEAIVTYDFSIETPPALLMIAEKKNLSGLIWPQAFVLWVTRRSGTVEVASRTSGDTSQCVHHLVRIRVPKPKEPERQLPTWRRLIRRLFNY